VPHDADRPDDAQPAPTPPSTDTSSSLEQDATIAYGDRSTGSVGVAGPIPSAPTGELPRAIGHYRILGKLGEGGMGIVYEAEQLDPKRRVALKVVRGRFVDENTIRMFRREAETLARLRHPHIGGIYESGRTEDGQHFFAMELVQGENLDAFLARRPRVMSPDEVRFRLALFRRIADAVHYAHQRGVIHRDLKPSNIIISREPGSDSSVTTVSGVRLPDLKILDFGLARITEGDVQATQVTEVGVIKGTLPYMSPEQARGQSEAIDVRTDVYALGVILYEMLASAKPYDVSRASLIEAVRVICEEPPRSLRNSVSGTRRLDPDIETVVGKALEKDADRRYASAAAMAEDVERHLASQPILARPPSTVYQLRKFAGRNRALVAGVVATFLVLVAGVTVSTMQALRARRAEALATSRMARAESAEALALAQRHEAEQARAVAETQTATAEMERSIAAVQRQAAEVSGQQAHMEAGKAGAISRFLQEMLATADPWAGGGGKVTLDAALERAQSRIGSWAGTDPDVDYAIRGTVASALAGVGKYAEAESLLRGGIDRWGATERQHPAVIAGLHQKVGGILDQTARYAQAEQEFRAALAAQALASRAITDTTVLMTNQVAGALAFQGRYPEADSTVRTAMAMTRGNRAVSALTAPAILRTRAYIQANWKEDFAGADSLLRRSVVLMPTLPGDRAVETSEALEEMAGNRVRMGDLEGADSLYSTAVAIRRKALGDNHPLVARALENQGRLLYKSGHLERTIEVLKQVLAIKTRGLGPEAEPVARTWLSLASVYAQDGKLADADNAFSTGTGILRRQIGDRHPDVASALHDWSDVAVREGKFDAGEKLARECLSIRVDRLGPISPGTIAAKIGLSDALRARKPKRFVSEAATLLTSARSEAIGARGPNDAGALKATQKLVEYCELTGRNEDATKWRAQLPPSLRAAGTR